MAPLNNLLAFCFLLIVHKGFSQLPQLDKARADIYNSRTDAERLANLVAMGKLRNSLHGDTIYRYAQWAKQLAIQLNDNKSLAWAEYSLISSDLAKGKTDSVLYKIENNELLKNIKKTDTTLYYKVQLLKANALNRMNNRPAALDLQLQLLNEAEKEGNTNAQLFLLNFIGATYINVNKYAEAREAWVKGLQIIKEKQNPENNEIEAYILSNLALYYFTNYYVSRKKEYSDSFFLSSNRTIELSRHNENLGVLASTLIQRGKFYGVTGQFEAGEKDIKEGLEVRKKIGDPYYVIDDYMAISSFYLSQKKYKECIETAKQGLSIATSNRIAGDLALNLMGIMTIAYKAAGDYKQLSEKLPQYFIAYDSINKINSIEKIADIQTKYEVQKKETLITKQKLELFQRKLLLYGVGILAALIFVFSVYQFKKYQQRQEIIAEQKRKQNQLAIKEAEEKERKRIAAELHDNLGVQANAILHNSSLLNAENNKTVVEDLQYTAKEMLLNLRETLWAMKTADVSATDLWLRIINFMKQMGRHYTALNFAIEGMPPEDFIISSTRALNIVLVLQETVNNAVKHAKAKTITAKSITHNNSWQLLIEDDGEGFNIAAAKQKNDSYGLTNMGERAATANFIYTIASYLQKGTTTTISIDKIKAPIWGIAE
jgi:two-component system, NarL family, sensor kinase